MLGLLFWISYDLMPRVRWGISYCAFQQTVSSHFSSCICQTLRLSVLECSEIIVKDDIFTRRCRRPLVLPLWRALAQYLATPVSTLCRQSLCPTANTNRITLKRTKLANAYNHHSPLFNFSGLLIFIWVIFPLSNCLYVCYANCYRRAAEVFVSFVVRGSSLAFFWRLKRCVEYKQWGHLLQKNSLIIWWWDKRV